MTDRSEALAWLAAGKVVAAATETFFGLLADASRPSALDRLAELKPRGTDKGIPLIVGSIEAWEGLVGEPPPIARLLAQRFWPGPLTIAVEPATLLDPRVMLDGTTAVRSPGPSVAYDLVRAYGRALTATSANPPGALPATDSTTVRGCFADAIAAGKLLVVDGVCPGGKPSSIVVVTASGLRIAREGAIDSASILDAVR